MGQKRVSVTPGFATVRRPVRRPVSRPVSRIDIQLPPVYSIFYIGTQVLASESSGAETLTTHCPPEAPSRLKLGKAVRIRRGCATVYGVEVYWVTGSCGEQMSWTLTSSMPREPGILPRKAEL